jgi:ribosomal protein L37AE/L43A
VTRPDPGYMPRENPCAQCGSAIAVPDWAEAERDRVSYLWQCRVCGYRFEAIAFYDEQEAERRPLAA